MAKAKSAKKKAPKGKKTAARKAAPKKKAALKKKAAPRKKAPAKKQVASPTPTRYCQGKCSCGLPCTYNQGHGGACYCAIHAPSA
jgi:hypothetical protein